MFRILWSRYLRSWLGSVSLVKISVFYVPDAIKISVFHVPDAFLQLKINAFHVPDAVLEMFFIFRMQFWT